MNEAQFQREFLNFVSANRPESVFAPHLELKYEIGKYTRGKQFGMPDTIPDVIEFNSEGQFHLWELKLLDASEVWSGKFFGQLMVYNFLFTTEPWNELLGRFAMCAEKKKEFVGDVGEIITHLASYGNDEVAVEGDKYAKFSSWNLCLCGGDGYELAAGYNPAIWSYWIIADEYFSEEIPPLTIWHFFNF